MQPVRKQKEKLLRVQGPRSHNGCQNCKTARVKCDEAAPKCGRCSRQKKPCSYTTATTHHKYQSSMKMVVYVPTEIDHWSRIPSGERRGMWHFQQRTIDQLKGPFGSELWSNILPRMVWDDALVRQAVLALSALHEHYLDHKAPGVPPPDHALAVYQKAISQTAKVQAPEKRLDSIMCACLVFSACEGLAGCFEESVRHAVAGMKIIAAQKTKAQGGSPVPEHAKRILSSVFTELQSQVLESNVEPFDFVDPASDERFLVPNHFENAEQAIAHLLLIASRFLRLFQDTEAYHEHHAWVPSQVAEPLQIEHAAICAAFSAWELAVSRSFGNTAGQQQPAYLLLEVQAHVFQINQYVYIHGEARYDDMIHKNWAIIDLVSAFLASYSATPTFASSPEVVPLLFEIATRTDDEDLSDRAIQMLRECNRREGIWDGKVAAQLAEHTIGLCVQGAATAEEFCPGNKFVITDILLLSEKKCLVRHGFKQIREASFNSFWFETIHPEEGAVQTQIIELD